MVKQIIELEDKAHDDLIKVLKLCEPDKGYYKEKIFKIFDVYFDKVYRTSLSYTDGYPKMLKNNECLITTKENVSIKMDDLLKSLIDKNYIKIDYVPGRDYNGKILKDISGNNRTIKYYKTIDICMKC